MYDGEACYLQVDTAAWYGIHVFLESLASAAGGALKKSHMTCIKVERQ